MLDKIREVSKSTGKAIWLDYGTLLGAYREHGFIPHDNDMDVAMYASDYDYDFERALFDHGFKILRQFTIINANKIEDRHITELTLKYKQVQIDLFLKFRTNNSTFGILWQQEDEKRNVWKAFRDYFDYTGFHEIDFLDSKAIIPDNTKDFLVAKYGDNFMTPIANWQPPKKIYLPTEEYYGEVIGGWIA